MKVIPKGAECADQNHNNLNPWCDGFLFMAAKRLIFGRVVQYSQIDSIGVSGDKKGLHWYQWYDWYQ